METIGNRIRKSRKALGLTQNEVAKAVGVKESAVSQWENDSTEPSGRNLNTLCQILQTSVEYLLYGRDEKVTALGYPLLTPNTITSYLDGQDRDRAYERVKSSQSLPDATFSWLIDDEALQNLIPKGSKVFVDPGLDIEDPAYNGVMMLALIKVGNRFTVRHRIDDFGRIIFCSTSGDHRPIEQSEAEVFGYVIGIAERAWTNDIGGSLNITN